MTEVTNKTTKLIVGFSEILEIASFRYSKYCYNKFFAKASPMSSSELLWAFGDDDDDDNNDETI